MEGRGRSRARKKHRIIVPKRLVAFMMTALMVFTTIGPDLSVAFAASEADVVFELDGADLVQSVEDAVAEGNEVTKEDVNFTDGDVDRYEELFFGEGKLYEAYPELNAGGSDADLRVFVRLPEDADESYIVTGDEELLFLFINNSDEAMTCRADITRVVNGKERTKKTRTMLVKSYMNVFDYIFGDAEVPEEIEDAVENGTLATDSDASNNNEEVPTATDSDAAVTLSLKDVPRVTAPADAVATDSDASKDETDTEDQTPADDETNADANGPAADDADEEKETSGEKPAVSAGDLVGIDWCSTARVYTTTLNKLGLMGTATEISAEVQGADGVTVTLSAREGVLPEGSYVEAVAIDDESTLEEMMAAANSELNPEDKIAVDIFAADVVLYDADGNEIQPDGSVRVTFEGTGLDADASTVFHMEDRGGVSLMRARSAAQDASAYNAKEMTSANADGDAVAFMTTHFSEYAVIETEKGDFYPVEFYYVDENQQEVVFSEGQYVQEIADVEYPAAPSREGYVFDEWKADAFQDGEDIFRIQAIYRLANKNVELLIEYKYTSGETAAEPWSAVIVAGTEYNETILSPTIEGYSADKETVTFSGKYEADQTVTVTYSGAEVDYTVEHWFADLTGDGYTKNEDLTEPKSGKAGEMTSAEAKSVPGFTAKMVPNVTIQANGTTVVKIYYERNAYRLSFITGENASYVRDENLLYGDSLGELETPTRLGYEFKGWKISKPETEAGKAAPATMPAYNLELEAQWEGNKVADYQIVYFLESADQDNVYDFIMSKSGTNGRVGQEIIAPNLTPSEWKSANIDSDGVERDLSKEQSVTITADGQAVKEVYYKRNIVTINFYTRQGNGGGFSQNRALTISAKYGADISEQWNDDNHSKYVWATSRYGLTYYSLMFNMPAEGFNAYGFSNNQGQWVVFYTENLDGTWHMEQKWPGKFSNLSTEDQASIEGFSFKDWQRSPQDFLGKGDNDRGTWYRKSSWLQYTRNSYEVSFENCQPIDSVELKYQQSLNSARPGSNVRILPPDNIDSDYVFGGWYTSPSFNEEVNLQIPVDWCVHSRISGAPILK